jgi:hypothetical protein
MTPLSDMGRWLFDHRLDLWCVVILGAVMAWLARDELKRRERL